ncbi:cardiolipin synthase [Marinilabiliaceae bacterium JC040]|nr:cardiolipin synthase [Marinilabiliaceae bacterium JC040]
MIEIDKISDLANNLLNGLTIVYVLLILFVVVLIILENRSPLKTIAWILVLILIPIGGFILYLFFGQNYRKQKMFSRKGLGDMQWLQAMSDSQKDLLEKVSSIEGEEFKQIKKIMTLLLNNSKALVSQKNKVSILNNGSETFPKIFEIISNAKTSINLEYYIFEEGELTDKLFNILRNKAKEGIKVRIIYDGVGSLSLKKDRIHDLKESGIMIYPFSPVHFPYLTHKANYRNHRKIIVVDNEYGFLGGLNFADRYINGIPNIGIWRDTHLLIHGEAVSYLQLIFQIDWYFVSSENLINRSHFDIKTNEEEETLIQLAASGADSDWASIQQAYFAAITSAKKNVYISTPYFMPGPSMIMALVSAAMSGVDVRVMLPAKSDSFITYWSTNSYIQELLDANIKVYQYNKGFNHSKIMMIDGIISTVGTANMDSRSFEQNFEINAIIYDKGITASLEEDFFKDLEYTNIILPQAWARRKKTNKILESFARLFSPLL